MLCRKCGNQLNDGDLVCNKCGEKVINDVQSVQQPIGGQQPAMGMGQPVQQPVGGQQPTMGMGQSMQQPVGGQQPTMGMGQPVQQPVGGQQTAQNGKKNNSILFVVIVLVFLVVIGILCFFLLGRNNDSNTNTNNNNNNSSANSVADNANTVNVNGYTVTVPNGLEYQINGRWLVVTDGSSIVAQISFGPDNFSEYKNNPDILKNQLSDGGVTSVYSNPTYSGKEFIVYRAYDASVSLYGNLFVSEIRNNEIIFGVIYEGPGYSSEKAFGYIVQIMNNVTGSGSSNFSFEIPTISSENESFFNNLR